MPKARTVTRLELAKALDCSPRTIAKWLEEGMPVAERGRGGHASRYDEAAVRAWLKKHERGGAASPLVEVARERARKERAQAILAEQLAASRAQELLPRDQVKKTWEGIVVAVRAKLLAAPAAYSDRLVRAFTLDGSVGHERAFSEVMREVCRELAQVVPAAPAAKGRKGEAA